MRPLLSPPFSLSWFAKICVRSPCPRRQLERLHSKSFRPGIQVRPENNAKTGGPPITPSQRVGCRNLPTLLLAGSNGCSDFAPGQIPVLPFCFALEPPHG